MDKSHPIYLALTPFIQHERVGDFSRYFQTFEGGYAFGDVFVGIMVPDRRLVAKSEGIFWDESLLSSGLSHPCHEVRHTALFAVLNRYTRDRARRQYWHDFLVENFDGVNNWDLVDTCAYKLLGRHAYENNATETLWEFLHSDNLWKRRAAVVATLHFIAKGRFSEALTFCPLAAIEAPEILQKGIGWVLKTIWEKQPELVEQHLATHYCQGTYTRMIVRIALEKATKEFRSEFIESCSP